MAFSAEELRVLRGALAVALQPAAVPASAAESGEYLRLAEALDEAVREGSRLRSFLLADLARYRAALPGSAAGYLEQLEDALAAGYLPRPDDLAALRLLCAEPAAEREGTRRTELLHRSERLAEQAVRARLLVLPGGRSAAPEPPYGPVSAAAPGDAREAADGPQPLSASMGGPASESPGKSPDKDPGKAPDKAPAKEPGESPSSPRPEPQPSRPVPTPAEVFPPRRRRPQEPGDEPAEDPSQDLCPEQGGELGPELGTEWESLSPGLSPEVCPDCTDPETPVTGPPREALPA